MGKIIAVWGTPNSGKTAFTMKLAGHLYETGRRRQTKVVAVLADVIAPSMPVVFPLYRSEDIYSLGELLAKTSITADDIFSYTTLLRGRENFGVLGYRDKENAHSHPAYTGEKALSFLNILAANTDYVLVDCMSEPENSILTQTALATADSSVRLVTPDLKCLSYVLSQSGHFMTRGYMLPTQITVMNTPNQTFAMPVADARSHLGKIAVTLPFSAALAEQSLEGSMSEVLKDRHFMQAVGMIAEKLR